MYKHLIGYNEEGRTSVTDHSNSFTICTHHVQVWQQYCHLSRTHSKPYIFLLFYPQYSHFVSFCKNPTRSPLIFVESYRIAVLRAVVCTLQTFDANMGARGTCASGSELTSEGGKTRLHSIYNCCFSVEHQGLSDHYFVRFAACYWHAVTRSTKSFELFRKTFRCLWNVLKNGITENVILRISVDRFFFLLGAVSTVNGL